MAIAIMDTDVLVSIMDELCNRDRRKFEEAISILVLRFNAIWIPKTVKEEFLRIKKREKILNRIMEKYQTIEECPITVSKNEIDLILNSSIQEGEADGILQTRKAPDYRRYAHRTDGFVFVSGDKRALKFASEKMGLDVMPYSRIRDMLREAGIIV